MKRNDILLILIPSLLFVIFWVGFNIYHNYISSTIPEVVNIQINPIKPSFDTDTINLLKNREQIIPNYSIIPSTQTVEESAVSSPSASSPIPTIIPTPTGIGNQQQASTGGSLGT